MGPAFVEALEVSRFHGVGPVTAARMRQLGIHTGRDLRACPLVVLQRHFGKAGAHFHAIARSEDDRPVQPDRPRKSAGSETTYERDLGDPKEVEAGVQALADEVWDWCERTGLLGRTVTLKLRYADFHTITRSQTSVEPVGSRAALAGTAVALVRSAFPLAKPVRLLGVTVSGFDAPGRRGAAQTALDFGMPKAVPPSADGRAGPSVAGVTSGQDDGAANTNEDQGRRRCPGAPA
jgi:DNA polymerase-4